MLQQTSAGTRLRAGLAPEIEGSSEMLSLISSSLSASPINWRRRSSGIVNPELGIPSASDT